MSWRGMSVNRASIFAAVGTNLQQGFGPRDVGRIRVPGGGKYSRLVMWDDRGRSG